jgi:membrane-bound lytic murein transglycosylase A
MSRLGGSYPLKIGRDPIAIAATFVLVVGIVAQPLGPSAHAAANVQRKPLATPPAIFGPSAHAVTGVERQPQFAPLPPAIFGPSAAQSQPLRLPDTALEPIEWDALKGWTADDHAAAFATFLASCRPLLRSSVNAGEKRPMYPALIEVCRRALASGRLTDDQARLFLERNFRPLRITKLGDNAGFLTGYYEPIIDGSRFPTGIFKVPIYRRPPDLVPPPHAAGPGFPNKGQSLRRTDSGALVPYYDRGEILDGALDGKHLEICWIKNQSDALTIQIQGSARVRLEDGAMLRINYDGHNGYPFVPLSRILIERNIIPREEMSLERIREWAHDDPKGAAELLRQNRSFMFFRIVGLSDDRRPAGIRETPHEPEAIGAQGISLTPERSIAVDSALHVYGTPFFIDADLPLAGEKQGGRFGHLMIAQDTGSAIVGPARADLFWGAGDRAGQLASHVHQAGNVAMLVPRELDPASAAARMPLPPQRPAPPAPPARPAEAKAKAPSKTSSAVQSHAVQARRPIRGLQYVPRDLPKSGAGWTMQSR